MKTLKESFLENAHMFIMLITLCITFASLGVRIPHSTGSYASFASFGYVPMSVQYVMDAEQHDLAAHNLQQMQSNIDHKFDYIQNSIQYAVDAEQQVLDSTKYINVNSVAGSEYGYMQKSIQYAVDTEQQVLDPLDAQQRQINLGRGEADQLTPAS